MIYNGKYDVTSKNFPIDRTAGKDRRFFQKKQSQMHKHVTSIDHWSWYTVQQCLKLNPNISLETISGRLTDTAMCDPKLSMRGLCDAIQNNGAKTRNTDAWYLYIVETFQSFHVKPARAALTCNGALKAKSQNDKRKIFRVSSPGTSACLLVHRPRIIWERFFECFQHSF